MTHNVEFNKFQNYALDVVPYPGMYAVQVALLNMHVCECVSQLFEPPPIDSVIFLVKCLAPFLGVKFTIMQSLVVGQYHCHPHLIPSRQLT